MPTPTRYGPLVPSSLDRVRSGAVGPLAGLPARATTRPGLLETVLASRSEREIMRQREAAAVTVEAEQIAAAVEVCVAQTRDTKELALKALQAETARGHADMEDQMQKDTHDAETGNARAVNQHVTEIVQAEKQVLDEVKALVEAGLVAADRAELVAEIVRAGTDHVIGSGLDLRDMIRDSRTGRLSRSLSRPR
ncbi:MAG: hypothetical protein ACT4OK_16235 [Gemmobacter sp.]